MSGLERLSELLEVANQMIALQDGQIDRLRRKVLALIRAANEAPATPHEHLTERCNDLSDLIRSKTDEHHKRLGGLDKHVDWLEQSAMTVRVDIENIEARLKAIEQRNDTPQTQPKRGRA
jgi:phage shock protein A